MAAAIEAAARGCEVTVLDESARPGGQIYRQADPRLQGTEFAEPTELARKKRLLRRFDEIRHAIDYRANAIAYAAFGNGEIHVQVEDRTEVLKPDAVVLATGMRERAIPFPGWTLPGVMFAGGAQAILKAQRTSPGRIAVVAGCGPLPIVVASQLTRAGTRVAALASLRSPLAILRSPGGVWHGRDIMREGLRYGRSLLDASVPRLTGYVPIRALGKERLEAVQLARVDEQGHVVPGTVREIACDLLAVNYGFIANSELAAMAGARIRHDPDGGFWLPETDEEGRTSLPWLFAAGDTAGLRGALVAESEGTIVGAAAASARANRGDFGCADSRRLQHADDTVALRASCARRWRCLWRCGAPRPTIPSFAAAKTCCCRSFAPRSKAATIRSTRSSAMRGPAWGGAAGACACIRSPFSLQLHAGVAPGKMMTPRPMARPVPFAALAQQKRAVEP